MIAYCPLEDLDPPVRQKKIVEEPEPQIDSKVGREETEMNYVIMALSLIHI